MLIDFSVRNYRSFHDRQRFSFSASADRAHRARNSVPTSVRHIPRLSKVALVFGPNASGKSNLLEALAALRHLVLHSSELSDAQFAPLHEPFRPKSSSAASTEFAIQVLLGCVRFCYAVQFDSQRVLAESLHVYRTGKSQRWFERGYDGRTQRESWQTFSSFFNGPRELWRKSTRPTALFLTVAAQLGSAQLVPLYRWFEQCLDVTTLSDAANSRRTTERVEDPKRKRRIIALMQAAGMRVTDVRMPLQMPARPFAERGRPVPPPAAAAPAQIEFLHRHAHTTPLWLTPDREAVGTNRLFAIGGTILDAIDSGKLLIIDQFDAGLHPLIARYLIQMVIDAPVATNRAQLLLTSYNTTLMDLQMLRRDEIWLMRLDPRGASLLVPIASMHPRKHEKIAKGYLTGRYDAIPEFRAEP